MHAKSLSTLCLLAMLLIPASFPSAADDPKDEQIVLELTITCSGNARYEQKIDTGDTRSEEHMTDQVALTLHEVSRWRIANRTGAAPHGPESELELERVSFQPTLTVGGAGGHIQEVNKKKELCGNDRLGYTERWLTSRTPTGRTAPSRRARAQK